MTWTDVNGAADHLGVSPRWIRRRIDEETLPFAYYKTGKHLRFTTEDLNRYLLSVRVEAKFK